jgi:hypothetical protein
VATPDIDVCDDDFHVYSRSVRESAGLKFCQGHPIDKNLGITIRNFHH